MCQKFSHITRELKFEESEFWQLHRATPAPPKPNSKLWIETKMSMQNNTKKRMAQVDGEWAANRMKQAKKIKERKVIQVEEGKLVVAGRSEEKKGDYYYANEY